MFIHLSDQFRTSLFNLFKACIFAGFFFVTGCQTTPQSDQLRQQKPLGIADIKQITDVPFYNQQQYYCGPTTLAEIFNYYGVTVSVEDIAPKIFIPDKEGSLQLEMVSVTRQYDLLPYTERGTLDQLLKLVDDDIPVIVFQNLSIQLWPQWHYAVVIGYDLLNGTILLHTGVTPHHEMSFELFEKTWARGNYWLLAPLPVGKNSQHLDPFNYIRSAYDMLSLGRQSALKFLQNATEQWPNQWLAYFLLANYYLKSQPELALAWFEKGYAVGQFQSAYLNNYAFLLAQQGCFQQALEIVEVASNRFTNNDDIARTRNEIMSSDTNLACAHYD